MGVVQDRTLATDDDNALMIEAAEVLQLGHDYLAAAERIQLVLGSFIRDVLEEREQETRYETDSAFRAEVDRERAEKWATQQTADDSKYLQEAKRVLVPDTRAFDLRAATKLLNRIISHKNSPHRAEALELLRQVRPRPNAT